MFNHTVGVLTTAVVPPAATPRHKTRIDSIYRLGLSGPVPGVWNKEHLRCHKRSIFIWSGDYGVFILSGLAHKHLEASHIIITLTRLIVSIIWSY